MKFYLASPIGTVNRLLGSKFLNCTGWACYDGRETLRTGVYSTTHEQGKPALIQVVLDPSEAIEIGPMVCSRDLKSASIGPPERISAADHRSDAIRQISENK